LPVRKKPYGSSMGPLRARVEKGRLVLDEPTTLPEGTVVQLVADDEDDDLTDEERRALHDALSASVLEVGRRRTSPTSVSHSERAPVAAVSLPVRTTPEADAQIRDIDEWWRKNRPAAPDLFLEELTASFGIIGHAPRHRPTVSTFASPRDASRPARRDPISCALRSAG